MEKYYFVTNWFLLAPIEKVWSELTNVKSWPAWWREFKRVAVSEPDSKLKVGSVADCEVKGGLPYTLRFSMAVTVLQQPNLIQFRIRGDLEGDYRWLLESQAGGGTAVTAYWDCGTPKTIMNFLAKLPLMKGVLDRNHENLMVSGYRVLKSRLEMS
ncbi:MAG: SRPBCC family protein [Chloroflexota bacterium]